MEAYPLGMLDCAPVSDGAATVILAMGHGRRAARAMNLYLSSGRWTDLEDGLELCRAEVR